MSGVEERSSCTLGDGRILTYIESGPPDGVVVLHHHGGLVSATDISSSEGAAERSGVRWVSCDRPGIGGSTPLPGRTLEDGARDAEEFLDRLGIGEVRVSGWSMGGPYALATMHRLGDRVARAAIIAGNLPLDDPANLAELNAMDRRFTGMATDHAAELRAVASLWGGLASFSPRLWSRIAAHGEGAEDEHSVRAVATELAASAEDATTQPEGIVEEYRAWARPWGFALGDIAQPVDVWQGTDDHLVPMEWAERMAHSLPSGRLHVVSGAGHFLLIDHADEVLKSLIDEGRH